MKPSSHKRVIDPVAKLKKRKQEIAELLEKQKMLPEGEQSAVFDKLQAIVFPPDQPILGLPIFDDFIKHQLVRHKEPVRAGIPKGQLIGLSFKKYVASLVMLTRFSLKKLAAWMHISYRVLIVWRSEQAFRDMVERNCQEFARYFRDRLYPLQGKDVYGFLDSFVAEEGNYREDVIHAIVEVLMAAIKEQEMVADPVSITFWTLRHQFGRENIRGVAQLFSLTAMKAALDRGDNGLAMEWLKQTAESIAKGLPEKLKLYGDTFLKSLS